MKLSNADIKFLKSLSSKKGRDESGLFVVEGEKMVAEALRSGFEVERVCRAEEIGPYAMARISSLNTPSPVLAVLRQRNAPPTDFAEGLYLALDSIRDPGNLGTILRIADWFGIRSVLASEDTVELYNPKVVQASMGAIFRVDFHCCSLKETLPRFVSSGGHVYGTFLDGRNIYSRALSLGDTSPDVIVIGNESNGISPDVAALVTDSLFIPSFPGTVPTSESLNAAVATARAVAEFRRRLWERR